MAAVRWGDWELLERVRTSGVVELFVARRSTGEEALLRRVLPAYASSPQLRATFVASARAWAQIDHPNVTRVIDAGEVDGLPFYAMAAAGTADLAAICERGPISAESAAHVALAVMRALAAGHARGVVHREPSPENILVHPGGTAEVAGFAVMEAMTDQAVSRSGLLSAQLRYGAPEYAFTGEYTPACDVFGFGVVLFEAMTAKHPYASDNPLQMAAKMEAGDHPPLASLVPDAPAELVAVIEASIRPEPSQRGDAASLATRLEGAATQAGRRELAERVSVPTPAAPPPVAGPPPIAAPPMAAPPPVAAPPPMAVPPVAMPEPDDAAEPATALDMQPLGAQIAAAEPPREEEEPATTLDMRALHRQLRADPGGNPPQAPPPAPEPPQVYPPTAVLPDTLQAQLQAEYGGAKEPPLPPMPPPSWEHEAPRPRPAAAPAAPSERKPLPMWAITALGILGVAAVIGVAVLLAILAASAT